MMRPFPPSEAGPNFDEVFAKAVEGNAYHTAIETATADVSVVLAAPDVAVDTVISFALPFEVAPVVAVWFVSIPTNNVYNNLVGLAPTTTGFTLRVVSGAAQTVKCRWLAYGQRMTV